MLNNISICGRICNDLDLKTTPSGVSVTTFSVAVDRNYKSGEEKQTDFIPVCAWRGTSEFICRNFAKGQLIIVSGRLQTRKYTTQNGENRTAFEIVAENVYFAGEKAKAATVQNMPVQNEPASDEFVEVGLDDLGDLPF